MHETGDADVIDVGQINAPWGKELLVQELRFSSGMRLARLRIREGHRFTTLDLDAATIAWLTQALSQALAEDGHHSASD